MSVEPRPNKYRATCRSCTGVVAPGAGRTWANPNASAPRDKRWLTVHTRCRRHYFWYEVGLALPVTPGDWAGPWVLLRGPDISARIGREVQDYDAFVA